MKITPKQSTLEIWAYGLFWSWNLIFLSFMLLGFAPRLLPGILASVRTGLLPLQFLVYGIILALVPVVSILLGLTVLRSSPGRLFAYGYVVEGPLMLLLGIRFFLIRQANPALIFIMVLAGLGMLSFLWWVLDPDRERRSRLGAWLRLFGLTLMLLTSLYAALWIAFYAVPITAAFLKWLGDFITHFSQYISDFFRMLADLFREGLAWVPFAFLGITLGLYTATLFVLTPIAVPWLSIRAWSRSYKTLADRSGRLLPTLMVLVTIAISLALFVYTNRQPQRQVFALLEQPPASIEAAGSLLKRQDSIRSGLLNAYLGPFRYISSTGEVRHISEMYKDPVGLPPLSSLRVQGLYEFVARPLLYEAVYPEMYNGGQWPDQFALTQEPEQAARLYQRFFDQPILEGERAEIVSAVRATWSADQAESAWQAVDEREVHLLRQEINLVEHGDWAEIELYEVYQNQTAQNQEVIYYFNLPESAVLTGLWLGTTPDRDMRSAFQVAPRGAAQAVYREQVRRNIDPALLEQIGPRQYRLRAFPVPPIGMSFPEDVSRPVIEEAPPFHLWLTFTVMAERNAWPMPRLAHHRNVYWDRDTVRLMNGAPLQLSDKWLPETLPAGAPIPTAHRIELAGGQSVLALPAAQANLPALPAGLKLAVVLDRSRSMAAHENHVAQALARLAELSAPGSPLDVYLTASPYRGEGPSMVSLPSLDRQDILYFGGQNPAELLTQFETISQGQQYDAILVLTDGTGYELGEPETQPAVPAAPLWMIHLNSDIPLGYDDGTLQAIQASGGGVVAELDTALARLALSLEDRASGGEVVRSLLDGYLWQVLPTNQAASLSPQALVHSPQDGFAALAARQLILAEMHRQRGDITALETLDQLHALAENYGIVTPYSSMIVLVNMRQQMLLDQLETLGDRYQREVEDLGNTTTATNLPLTGVPEPHEWLLIGVAVALLLYYARRQGLVFKGVKIL